MGQLDSYSTPKANSKHHYAFAHYALPHATFDAFENPAWIFDVLGSEDRTKLFDILLNECDTNIKGANQRDFTGADIEFVGALIEDRPCAILRMPPTTTPGEAYFIAIVGRLPLDQLASRHDSGPEETPIDYYTLERSIENTPDRPSVFCSWTSDGTHHNYGSGPKPTLEHFYVFLTDYVKTRKFHA